MSSDDTTPVKKIYSLKLLDAASEDYLETSECTSCLCCKEYLAGHTLGLVICGECVEALSQPLRLGPRPLSPAELEEYGAFLEEEED